MSELIQKKPLQNESHMRNLVDQFTSMKREAFIYLDEALSHDSLSNQENAIVLYEKSLESINKSLKFFEAYKMDLDQNEEAVKINTQLNRMKEQASDRLEQLKKPNKAIDAQFLDMSDQILDDTYDFVTIEEEEEIRPPFSLADSETRVNNNKQIDSNSLNKASELLNIENGAQIYYIANDGSVSTPSKPATLSIYSFDQFNTSDPSKNIVAFIKVGSWLYPLIPNESPAMKTNFDSYIFPNENQSEPTMPASSFIGITFTKNTSMEQKSFFEDVLSNYGALIYQNPTTGKHLALISN
jgi:hypothetical protein